MDPQFTSRFLDTLESAPKAATETDNRGTLSTAFAAIVRGDFDAFGAALTDDAELEIRGSGIFDGSWRGVKEIVAAARINYGKVEGQQPEIEAMISQGDAVAVLLRERGLLKADRRKYSLRAVQWFSFSNGKIRKIVSIAAPLVD